MGYVRLTDRTTGKVDLVADDQVDTALASGKYVAPDAVAVNRAGENTYVAPDIALREQDTTQTIDPRLAAQAHGHAIREADSSGIGGTARAFLGRAVDTASFGAFSPFEEDAEFHPIASIGGSLAGMFAPGAIEHLGGALSSRLLYAGEVGRDAGTTASALERGLLGASRATDTARAGADVVDAGRDLTGLSAKDLRAERAAELERVEAGRVPQRAQIADDLKSFRSDLKQQKLWLVTKDADQAELRVLGKRTLKADKQLDSLLDNPMRLAEKPELAKAALQQQEAALQELVTRSDKLREAFDAEGPFSSKTKLEALDKIPAALERNRSLQAKMAELVAEPKSARLTAIQDAADLAAMPKAATEDSFVQKMLKGATFGKVSAAVGMTPLAPLAHVAGAKAADLIDRVVFGRAGEILTGAATKAQDAAEAVFNVAKKGATFVPRAASSVLNTVRFAPSAGAEDKPGKSLAESFTKRSAEIRSQTAYDATGMPRVTPAARQAIAARFDPIRLHDPIAADRLETFAVNKLEFLSGKLPRIPDFGSLPVGMKKPTPRDSEMRTWARFVDAAENPDHVEQRLARGVISPEDAETYRALYPERAAALQAAIAQKLPTTKAHSYQKRIALSMFAGMPADPSMSPMVIAALQGHFANEQGSQGGTQNPTPSPQFGSVKKSAPMPTPADRRAQGG